MCASSLDVGRGNFVSKTMVEAYSMCLKANYEILSCLGNGDKSAWGTGNLIGFSFLLFDFIVLGNQLQ